MKRTFLAAIIVLLAALAVLLAPIVPPERPDGSAQSVIGTIFLPDLAQSQPSAPGPIPQNPNPTIKPNLTDIHKITTNQSKNRIAEQIAAEGFARITVSVDRPENIDAVISTLTENEFIFEASSGTYPPSFSGRATEGAIRKLNGDSRITGIYFAENFELLLAESVPLINATVIWPLRLNSTNLTGENTTICIVDTGINYTHPDLGGCANTSNISSADCSKVIGGYDFIDDDWNPMDQSGHGTQVAGVAAANGTAKGVAPGAKLVVIRVNEAIPDQVKAGINWCINNRSKYNPPISIISLSIGGSAVYNGSCDTADVVVQAANTAQAANLILFAAAGNMNNATGLVSPACGSNVTSVSAVYDADLLSPQNLCIEEDQFGNCVEHCLDFTTYPDKLICATKRSLTLDLLAPGGAITTTNATNGYQSDILSSSAAAPHAAGAAAILIEYWRLKNERPLFPSEIEQILKGTGKPILDINLTNFSRIDVYAALFPIDVYNFSMPITLNSSNLSNASNSTNVFKFKVRNQNNSYQNLSFGLETGNGTWVNASNLSVPPKKEVLVFVERNYTAHGTYDVTAWASNGREWNASESLNFTRGWLTIYNFSAISVNNTERTFRFKVNNTNSTFNITRLNWTIDFGDNTSAIANANRTIANSTEHFFYAWHNYTSGNYTVRVNATARANGSTITGVVRPFQIAVS